MRKYNILIGLFSLLFGVLILYLSRNMAMFDEYGVPGERFWPFGLACLFIALGILQWISVFIHRAAADRDIDFSSPGVRRAYVLSLVAIVYAIALGYLGFAISSLLFIPATMVLMNEKRPWYIALTSIVMVIVIWLFFTQLFNSPLPVPEFLES